MTTEPENLWGPLPLDTDLRPPIAILREQASMLTKASRGLLVGDIVMHSRGDNFLQSSLDILVVPVAFP
jgi:hypothetical protein